MDHYCKNGDPEAATKAIYETATARGLKTITRRMMSEPRIVTVLELWNGHLEGEPSIDEYRHELWRMARECKSDAARASLMRLYGEARGFIKKSGLGPQLSKRPDASILDEIENGNE